jgi:hypothetical protein
VEQKWAGGLTKEPEGKIKELVRPVLYVPKWVEQQREVCKVGYGDTRWVGGGVDPRSRGTRNGMG